MPTNLKAFNREVNRLAKHMTGPVFIEFHRRIALDAFTRIVQKTPIDTGHARGNWQLAVGMAERGEIDGASVTPAAQLAAAASALDTLQVYAVVYITNNVQYISYLEDGHSQQAPQGMVAVSLEEMRQVFVRAEAS